MNFRSLGMRIEEVGNFIDLHERVSNIEGWLHPLEGYLLYLLAAEGPGVGEIVEIGSYLGRSTAFLASGASQAKREKVTAVDHFQGSPEHQAGQSAESKILRSEGTTLAQFSTNLIRVKLTDQVTPFPSSSEDAARSWTKPIRLLFIDAEHSFEASQKDFQMWSPFVVPGGVICLHDIGTWPGVTRFYQEFMHSTKEFKETMAVLSIRVIERQNA